MSVSSDDFKAALGRWASGVSVVTSRAGDEIHGMTVSAFSSVSLDPPLVLICANAGSKTHDIIERGGCFAVNILAYEQEALSNHFAIRATEAQRFENVKTHTGATGAPLLDGCVANLDCRVQSAHREGSHTIYIGLVEHVEAAERAPLLYCRSGYGGFEVRRA
jgi:flavin reductase (DIM6/NTAB) family NADH-FMN oxidoreductase RutF